MRKQTARQAKIAATVARSNDEVRSALAAKGSLAAARPSLPRPVFPSRSSAATAGLQRGPGPRVGPSCSLSSQLRCAYWLPACAPAWPVMPQGWHTAWMTGLRLALANLKPGTGKTTSAVWLAHVFAQAGNSVLLVDADPSGSALEWSDLAAMEPRLAAPQAAFPFRIVALPSRELHRRLPDIARDDDVVIIDTPQIEDHGAIARSALRYADEIVIPCAPNPIEINRTTPVRDEIADVDAVRDRPARSAVLLNRCITRAHSISDARQALQDLGYDVLATAVPRLEVYAQSFGMPISDTGCDMWRQVVRDLVERCAPPCPVRS